MWRAVEGRGLLELFQKRGLCQRRRKEPFFVVGPKMLSIMYVVVGGGSPQMWRAVEGRGLLELFQKRGLCQRRRKEPFFVVGPKMLSIMYVVVGGGVGGIKNENERLFVVLLLWV